MHMRKQLEQACLDARTARAQTTQPAGGKNTIVVIKGARKFLIVKGFAASALLIQFQGQKIED